MKKVTILLLIFISIFSGCSSGKAVTGSGYYFEFDDQYYFIKASAFDSAAIAATKDGYYFFGGPLGMYLYYMDKSTMKPVLMCNKPDCRHIEETDPAKTTYCNALFYCSGNNMVYYDSSLYMLAQENSLPVGCVSALYQVSLDASKRKKIYTFKDAIYSMIIHRGYLYYAVNESAFSGSINTSPSKCRLCRIVLQNTGKAPETIFEYQGICATVIMVRGYGDSVFFNLEYYKDEAMTNLEASIYKYDDLTNMCVKLIDNANNYAINSKTILFCDTSLQMYSCNLDGKDIRKIDNMIGSPFGADDKYIYLWTWNKDRENLLEKLLIYDWSGREIKSLDLRGTLSGGDEKYFFIYQNDGLYVIDKSKLADGTATLEKVYDFNCDVDSLGIITD